MLRDDVLDIAVTPDRGYCLSLRGLAREAAQATGVAFTDPVDRPVPLEVTAGHPVELESDACPLFVAIGVTGIDATRPSPRWLSRRVQLAGMRSISLAVDVTNYVMLETGQPIHAYDADRLDGPIVVRKAADGEKLTTLDDVAAAAARRRPVDHRRLGTDRPGRGDGRGDDRALRRHDQRDHRGRALRRDDHRPHLAPAQAVVRGVPPVRAGVDPAATYAAAHRVAQLLVELAGGTLAAAETVRGTLPPRATTEIADTLPGAISAPMSTMTPRSR